MKVFGRFAEFLFSFLLGLGLLLIAIAYLPYCAWKGVWRPR